MNIFAVDYLPSPAARMLHDQHVVKMVLESAQLLCTTFHVASILDPEWVPYKPTHTTHPCAVWARTTTGNFQWLASHALELATEYRLRFGRIHKSAAVIEWATDPALAPFLEIPNGPRTPFAQAMPAALQGPDPVAAYRTYYMLHKIDPGTTFRNSNAARFWENLMGLSRGTLRVRPPEPERPGDPQ